MPTLVIYLRCLLQESLPKEVNQHNNLQPSHRILEEEEDLPQPNFTTDSVAIDSGYSAKTREAFSSSATPQGQGRDQYNASSHQYNQPTSQAYRAEVPAQVDYDGIPYEEGTSRGQFDGNPISSSQDMDRRPHYDLERGLPLDGMERGLPHDGMERETHRDGMGFAGYDNTGYRGYQEHGYDRRDRGGGDRDQWQPQHEHWDQRQGWSEQNVSLMGWNYCICRNSQVTSVEVLLIETLQSMKNTVVKHNVGFVLQVINLTFPKT